MEHVLVFDEYKDNYNDHATSLLIEIDETEFHSPSVTASQEEDIDADFLDIEYLFVIPRVDESHQSKLLPPTPPPTPLNTTTDNAIITLPSIPQPPTVHTPLTPMAVIHHLHTRQPLMVLPRSMNRCCCIFCNQEEE